MKWAIWKRKPIELRTFVNNKLNPMIFQLECAWADVSYETVMKMNVKMNFETVEMKMNFAYLLPEILIMMRNGSDIIKLAFNKIIKRSISIQFSSPHAINQ